MDITAAGGDRYVLLQERPAVIVVEVDRDRGFSIGTSGDDLPDISFAAVVDVTVIERVDELHPDLRGAVAELVATDVENADFERAQNAAVKVLEQWGFGQDFVFTLPELEEAIRYAAAAVEASEFGFKADAVMVVGPSGTKERTRAALGLE